MFRHIKKFLSHDYILIFLQVFFLCFVYLVFSSSFKLIFFVTALIILLLNLINRDIFLSIYLTYLVSLLYLEPGKYYQFLMIEKEVIEYGPFSDTGLFDAYGIIISDLLAFFIGLYLIRKILYLFIYKKERLIIYWFDKFVFLSFFIYFIISFFSSKFYSFNYTFSLFHLFQYSKLLISYSATSYLVRNYKQGKKYLAYSFLGLILFNLIIGFSQFLSFGSFNREIFSYHLPEEKSLFVRPSGVLLHSNQLGFLILLWLTSFFSLSSFSFSKKLNIRLNKVLYFLVAVLIVITQSRTIWILSIPPLFLFILYFLKRSKKKLINKNFIYLLLPFLLLTGIVSQRLLLSRFSLDGGSASIRLRMIKEGLFSLRESYLFGFGPATNVKIIHEFIPNSYVKDFPFAVHMGYLQMALESGVIATFFFFLPFVILLFIMLKFENRFMAAYLMLLILVYYVFQPYAGRLEFPFLGIFLMIASLGIKNERKNDL